MEGEVPNSGVHDCAVSCVFSKPGPQASSPTVGLLKIEKWDAVTEESGGVSVPIPLVHLISVLPLPLSAFSSSSLPPFQKAWLALRSSRSQG